MEPPNIPNLERILTGIKNGKLEHNQSSFFCGTACCVAGWDVALNAAEQPKNAEDRQDWFTFDKTLAYSDPWEWSKTHNNLTGAEAFLFFAENSTFEVQWATLNALKLGRRISVEEVDCYWIQIECYSQIFVSGEYLTLVKAFFEGVKPQITVLEMREQAPQ